MKEICLTQFFRSPSSSVSADPKLNMNHLRRCSENPAFGSTRRERRELRKPANGTRALERPLFQLRTSSHHKAAHSSNRTRTHALILVAAKLRRNRSVSVADFEKERMHKSSLSSARASFKGLAFQRQHELNKIA